MGFCPGESRLVNLWEYLCLKWWQLHFVPWECKQFMLRITFQIPSKASTSEFYFWFIFPTEKKKKNKNKKTWNSQWLYRVCTFQKNYLRFRIFIFFSGKTAKEMEKSNTDAELANRVAFCFFVVVFFLGVKVHVFKVHVTSY